MQSALYVSLSAQLSAEKRLTTVANNIANANTGGFRAEDVKFEALLAKSGSTPVAFSSTGETFISRREGSITKTDNNLDVAIQGKGFFSFATKDGVGYTRDGRLKMAVTGNLQTLDGFQVLDASGGPLRLDPEAGDPVIGRDGSIMQRGIEVGALGLFELPESAKLTRYGNSGVLSSEPAKAIQEFNSSAVLQGYSEGSNVNPMHELTKLIALQRNFDSASTMVKEAEDTSMSAIRALGPST
jgi:flagellar basal-body rod protein FlgF